RDHKENINPHKPTRKHLHHTRVIDQHQPNRNSPQPLNIRPKTPTPTTNTTRMPAAGMHSRNHHHHLDELPGPGRGRATGSAGPWQVRPAALYGIHLGVGPAAVDPLGAAHGAAVMAARVNRAVPPSRWDGG